MAVALVISMGSGAGRVLPPSRDASSTGRATGLPVPRFVSLRSDDVNLRVGPGKRYPTAWVVRRRFLPVKILREFKDWRDIQLPDGTEGWVHSSTLVGRRSLFVKTGPLRILRATASKHAPPVARLQAHVVGRIMSCAVGAEWCRVEVAPYQGYLQRDAFWGTFPAEAVPG